MYVDEMRQTRRSIDNAAEHTLNDYLNDEREVFGRPTKVQKTTRPDTIWPEEWLRLSKKQKQQQIAASDDDKTRLEEARRRRLVFDVSPEDAEYTKLIFESRAKLERCVVPSMPCIPRDERTGKPDVKCAGEPEAMNVSRSARTKEKHRSTWTT